MLTARDTPIYLVEHTALRGLMSEEQPIEFTATVGKLFSSDEDDARTLWLAVAQEYDRAGPEAAREHLATESQSFEERVKRLLSQVAEGR